MSIREKLEVARRELLDLGLRNPLLNHRLLRARGVEVINEKSAEVFRLLVREGRRMTFKPGRDEDGGELLFQPEEDPEQETGAHHLDTSLQTAISSGKLQSRLLATWYAARTFIEEQGINTLYLALGRLLWYESDFSEEPRRAPLLLIPAALERSGAIDRFHLRYNGEDIGANLSLEAKLKSDFGITLPEFPDLEDFDPNAYFDAVEQAVAGRKRWSVERNSIALGLFSFAKLLMFRDLDEAAWPEENKPSEAPLIAGLLGEDYIEPPFRLSEDDHLDRVLAPRDIFQVVDADGSQVLALAAADEGRNLVIQGPPGTGKSQTITNLIADAIGKGKKVLFVAEKMAALDVVKRRLDAVGLGDACLELHSHKTNKKSLLVELQRTLNLGRPVVASIENELQLLVETRRQLNDYCEAINTPIGSSGVAPYEAYGRLLQLKANADGAAGALQFDLPGMSDWTAAEYTRRKLLIADLQTRLGAAGAIPAHPFRASRLRVLLPSERDRLSRLCGDAHATTARLIGVSQALASALGLDAPVDRAGCELLARAAKRAFDAPHLKGVRVDAAEWQSRRDDLRDLLAAGERMTELHAQYDTVLIPEAWTQDILEVRVHLANYGDRWWRFLAGDHRRAKRRLRGLCRGELPRGNAGRLALVDAILEMQRARRVYETHAELGARIYGAQWQGERSDWRVLAHLTKWMIRLYDEIGAGDLPSGLIVFLSGDTSAEGLSERIADLESALAKQKDSVQRIVPVLDLDEDKRFGAGRKIEEEPLGKQERIYGEWAERISDLYALVAYNHQAEVCRERGLGEIVDAVESWIGAIDVLESAFDQRWYESLLERAIGERRELAAFEGESHRQVVERFRRLDEFVIEQNRKQLAREHWRRLPQHEAGGQLGVLRREFEKRARHIPIRQLMTRAGNAVQAIKPVFMMGPLSVAAFLTPGALQFDLVVFDEASQVKPVDSFGAILRGRQLVVVGDSKQMPPTSFFDKMIEAGEDEEVESETRDIESILGLCVARGVPERMLRWHYRSRHESLIAVSNYEFYDNRLIVFPSCERDGGYGLKFHHLPHAVYDAGKSRANAVEAQAVAAAVIEHARAQLKLPEEERRTLLVATFSMAQMEAIWNRLELLRREHRELEEFFREGTAEPFDVKNLENVQGDERDVIFISVGYGRTEDGRISMNFGPLNREGGERRLNVLITRARRRCEVFTNLTADNIDLNRTNARGVRALKTFLQYAQRGRMDTAAPSGREADSPFEEEVRKAIEREGYAVAAQVGSAGFFIDLAVIDPERPGKYLLGIECDGASYHSSRAARDRDRLRQQVLEGLGWRIHRIWSTDWFQHPGRELKRAIEAIERARIEPAQRTQGINRISESNSSAPEYGSVVLTVPEPSVEISAVERSDAAEDAGAGIAHYEVANLQAPPLTVELHAVASGIMADWVAEVVRVESPVHVSEIGRRIAAGYGVSRIGNRIAGAIEAGCRLAVRKNLVLQRGEFYWNAGMEQPVVRDRSGLPEVSRKMELIAPEEIGAAVELVVERSYGIGREQLPDGVRRLFGFQRTTESMRTLVGAAVERAIGEGRIVEQGGHLLISNQR